MLLASRDTEANLKAYYAADAGVESVLNDLVNRTDLAGGTMTVTLNNSTASVTVILPTGAAPLGLYQYVDPDTGGQLSSVPKKEERKFVILYVRPNSDIQVNWAFSPTSVTPPVKVRVEVSGGQPVGTRVSGDSPARLFVPGSKITGGSYTVVFDNNSNQDLATSDFSPSGGLGNTWVWVNAHKDYVITSSTPGITIRSYARQSPGVTTPNTMTQTVQIYSWQVQ
jgi:hypothetical protein